MEAPHQEAPPSVGTSIMSHLCHEQAQSWSSIMGRHYLEAPSSFGTCITRLPHYEDSCIMRHLHCAAPLTWEASIMQNLYYVESPSWDTSIKKHLQHDSFPSWGTAIIRHLHRKASPSWGIFIMKHIHYDTTPSWDTSSTRNLHRAALNS